MGKNANPSYSVETKQIRTILSGWYLLSPLLMGKLQILTSDSYLGQPEVIQGHLICIGDLDLDFDLDLGSKIVKFPTMLKSDIIRSTLMREIQWWQNNLHSLLCLNGIGKPNCATKPNFLPSVTSGAKTIDLRSILLESW